MKGIRSEHTWECPSCKGDVVVRYIDHSHTEDGPDFESATPEGPEGECPTCDNEEYWADYLDAHYWDDCVIYPPYDCDDSDYHARKEEGRL